MVLLMSIITRLWSSWLLWSSSPSSSPSRLVAAETLRPDSRSIRILNQAGHRIDIFWINRWKDDELILSSAEGGVLFGTEQALNSFVGHEFQAVELPSKKTGVCGGPNNECRSCQFQVSANDDQLITIYPGMKVVLEDNKSRARNQAKEILARCRTQIKSEGLTLEERITAFSLCMEKNVNASLQELEDEISFQSKVRTHIGQRLSSYACQDLNYTATEPKENQTWEYQGVAHDLRILHDRASSHIAVVEDFATPEECQAVLDKASANMQAVDGANGLYGKKGSVSMADVQNSPHANDPLRTLVTKMYRFAHDFLKFADQDDMGMATVQLSPLLPQEDLFVLQYEGSANNNQRYEPHCDGPCDASNFVPGERVATMIIYCNVPEQGGATHFGHAGIHVKPEPGRALFFNYIDPLTLDVDDGFTQHQGCQVLQGQKQIISHKFRSTILPKDDDDEDAAKATKEDDTDESKREL